VKLTRERKIYLALAGLGAFAFAADRLFFSPADAGAAGPQAQDCAITPDKDAPAPSTGAEASKPAPAPAATTPDPRFSDLLRQADPNVKNSKRDLFRPPDSWPKAAVANEFQGPPLPDFDEFLHNHAVRGVIQPRTGQPGMAWVGGKIFKAGDNVDGFTLVSVSKDDVEFEAPGGERRKVQLVSTDARAAVHAEPAPDAAPDR
jgi:hypothetical protein